MAQASCTELTLPEYFVIATGHMHSVREFVEKSFAFIGKEIVWEGKGKHPEVKCFYSPHFCKKLKRKPICFRSNSQDGKPKSIHFLNSVCVGFLN